MNTNTKCALPLSRKISMKKGLNTYEPPLLGPPILITECRGEIYFNGTNQFILYCTVKPPIKDTPKEDKPRSKGQAKIILLYTHSIEINPERGQPLHKGQNGWS